MLLQLLLLLPLNLLETVGSQQAGTCSSEGSRVVCRSGPLYVQLLEKSDTWRGAHEQCRRRGQFLVPSDAARQKLLDVLPEVPSDKLQLLGTGFWAGATLLRNGFYQWQLPALGADRLPEELIRELSGKDRSRLCGLLIRSAGHLKLSWTACSERRPVVCFSDGSTERLTKPAGYRPSLTVTVGEERIRPGAEEDAVLQTDTSRLDQLGASWSLLCGDDDSVVKDHFILGRTEFRSDQWPINVTILRQIHPPAGDNRIAVGSYWCQRYVDGAVNPVISGTLHVTTSENMYVLTRPRSEIVAMIASIATAEDKPRLDSRLLPFGRSSSLETQLKVIANSRRSSAVNLRYMALYDSFDAIDSTDSSEDVVSESYDETVKLLFDADISPDHWIFDRHASSRNQTARRALLKVFKCEDESTTQHLWQQQERTQWFTGEKQHLDVLRTEYEFSEPVCVTSSGRSRVGRRCMPHFDEGARWGPFCTDNACTNSPPHCLPRTSECPGDFQPLLFNDEEGQRVRVCALLVPDVALEDRAPTCWRREPTATPWTPPWSAPLDRAVLPTADRPVWLPYRRLWPGGPLWPRAASLLTGNSSVMLKADLQTELDCAVVTPDAELRSVACGERHAVICIAPPVELKGDNSTVSWFPRRGNCSSTEISVLGLGPEINSVLIPGLSQCITVDCRKKDIPVAWSELASLCDGFDRSLAILTSQRLLDIVLRLVSRAEVRGGPLVAVNLTRHDGRVVWGDGSELTYPALSPNFPTTGSGVLDISRGLYSFIGEDDPVKACSLCERRVPSAAPEIVLFFGASRSDETIFANVSNVNRILLSSSRQSLSSVLSCFVSISQNSQQRYRVRTSDVTLSSDQTSHVARVLPEVNFGFLLCGAETIDPRDIIVSNTLVLKRRYHRYEGEIEEYVVGLKMGSLQDSECDLTYCLDQCSCFNQSLPDGVYRSTENGGVTEVYRLTLQPMGTTPSNNEHAARSRIEQYFAALEFFPASRRRRQAGVGGSKDASQLQGRSISRGFQLLRDEFGSQLAYVKPARCCPAEKTQEPIPLSWPETCGGVSTSEELCLDGTGRPALRHCLGGPLTGVQWGPVEFHGTSCTAASAVTTNLHRLSQTPLTAENAARAGSRLARLTAEPVRLISGDLISVAVTLEHIQARLEENLLSPQEVTALQRSAVATVSHIMKLDTATIAEATESIQAGPRIVHALERILIVPSAVNNKSMTTDNVAVRSGDIVGISSFSQDISNSTLQTVARDENVTGIFGVEAALLLLDSLPTKNAVFLVYRDGRLLHSSGQRVTSQVVSVLLPDTPVEVTMKSSVLITFRQRPEDKRHPQVCAYWDFNDLQWSTRGCWLEMVRNGSDVCRCNHLTNFARIFNYEKDVYLSRNYHHSLDIITYVGCALSLCGLFLTMLTFALFKKWRKSRGSQIVVHMSAALTGVYLSFLLDLATLETRIACITLSVLLHYFLLATFGWMAVEAVFQYLRFVRVVGTYISRFMHKASLLVWGGSLVPVICVLALGPDRYDGQPDVCWMDFQSFHYALVMPVAVVILFNAIMFGLIVYSLNCGRQKGLRTNQSERQLALRRLHVSLVTFVLLGLPWVFGFLSIREARRVFSVLFCICSMLQGLTIFLLLVAGESSARGLWAGLMTTVCRRRPPPASGPGTEDVTDQAASAGRRHVTQL